jgi:cell division protein ZapE
MGLAQSYAALLESGKVKPDAAQLYVQAKLAALSDQLNQSPKPTNFIGRIFKSTAKPTWRGLYIYGEVGRGKTFLMDLFFESVSAIPKLRIHFHAFMQDVHAKRTSTKSKNVIADIADELSSKAKLLCLDEMQISDIADAMIIGRLFAALYARGVCIVTTSNLPPDGLYKDGLNRQLFIPFIKWMNEHLDVIHMGDGMDYRLGRLASRQTYLVGNNTSEMNDIWDELTDHSVGESISIEVLGRKLGVPHAAHACARFTFAEICESPLGAPDYLALARNFRTIFIDHVPVIKSSNRNEAKRFILMIDTFYDCKTKLVISAAAPPEKLYPTGQHAKEFARTVSRLKEMQSASWWKATQNDERTSTILS